MSAASPTTQPPSPPDNLPDDPSPSSTPPLRRKQRESIAAHFVNRLLTALYSAAAGVWEVLDWFMAASVLLALAGYGRRWLGLSQADKSDLREYVGVNAGFYASVVLTMWFFPNWFNVLAGEEEMTMPWGFVDGLFVVVVGSVAANLWRASKTAA